MSLENLRGQIDNLDKMLVKLLNDRAKLSLRILQEKQKAGLPIYNKAREDEVLQNVINQSSGPLTPEQIKLIFQQVIESCRNLQQNQKGIESWLL